MGFLKRWDVDSIKSQLTRCAIEACSGYNDGYSQWNCKKDLLDIKYMLDDMLERMPTFSNLEDEYHEEREKDKAWKVLNDNKINQR
jgi:hypothetical protein